MSCLASLDKDDKEAGMNVLTLLPEPVGLAQGPISYIDSFSKPTALKQNNNAHDVLSNSDVLSPGCLGNGPSSHWATQASDSSSTEKEEEKSITPLKTVQEIDTAGIWGFDIESPENSLDDFSSASNLHWDPHKEFMQFLWDNHDESPGEEPQKEVPPPISQRRRKRKMDMVVMVDPSEDLSPALSYKSSEDSTDGEDPTYNFPTSTAGKLRTHSTLSSSTVSNYPNGTAKAIKQILYNAPNENSIDGLSPVKGRLSIQPHSDEKLSCYTCSKCNLIFKQEHQLQRHIKSHAELTYMSQKPFICRECGESFKKSGSLVDHMSVHQEKRQRTTEEIKETTLEDDKDLLHCPQCPFRTKSPDSFVSHAKTHEKSKRYFDCEKCSYKAASQNDLVKHDILRHIGFCASKANTDESGVFTCRICSYRVFSLNVFKTHLQRRHQQTYEEYNATQESDTKGGDTKGGIVEKQLISPILIKRQEPTTQPSSCNDSNYISDLFKNDKSVNKCLKSQLTESKLDKSINVLLSRQRLEKGTEKQEQMHKYDQDSNGSKNSQLPGKMNLIKETYSLSDVHSKPLAAKLDPNSRCDSSATETESYSTSKPVLDRPVMKKSPSKRKMSTPSRNTNEQETCFIIPKLLPSPKRLNLSESEDPDEKDGFQFDDKDANTNLFNNGIKPEKTLIYPCSRRMSIRGALQASKELFNRIKTEPNGQNEPVIKEEDIETEVFTDNLESHPMTLEEPLEVDWSVMGSDCRSCPYCPEVFDSGVGLSNHVRGHLHRVGLSYNARHVVSPEQVASKDKRPRIRRKMSAIRQLKKAFQIESSSEVLKSSYSCPLCGDSFDNKTGQSNHIRGHLKRLGKHISTKSKTPLCLLRELMRDKKEYHRALQILGKKRDPFQFAPSSKMAKIDGLILPQVGLSKKNLVQTVYNNVKQQMSKVSVVEMASEKKQLETKLEVKGPLSGASALIGILKKRKCQEDSKWKSSLHMSRNPLAVSSTSDHSTSSRDATTLPNSISEKGEFNRKVCIHCNATFHSGVSLSNHLRAYAKRKRTALIEGTTYDCKARRYRSRPGSKKKTLPIPHTPEEMYRLTCRFCDLVFQGPLSVQEDWIKHLQRHIMNTSVPHTGLSMVEVPWPSMDPLTLKADQDISLTATHSAS